MELSDREKAKLGAEALSIFFNQLGPPDIYNKIVWEEVFEEMNREDISVSGKKRQEGNQNTGTPEKPGENNAPKGA